MVAKRLPLLCVALAAFSGCGQPSAPVSKSAPPPPLPRATPALPPPNAALWAGKTLDEAVSEYLEHSRTFADALKKVRSDADVPAQADAIAAAAQKLRVTRFALADLGRGARVKPEQRSAIENAGSAVAGEVARLLDLPGARTALHESFLQVRSAPALQF